MWGKFRLPWHLIFWMQHVHYLLHNGNPNKHEVVSKQGEHRLPPNSAVEQQSMFREYSLYKSVLNPLRFTSTRSTIEHDNSDTAMRVLEARASAWRVSIMRGRHRKCFPSLPLMANTEDITTAWEGVDEASNINLLAVSNRTTSTALL